MCHKKTREKQGKEEKGSENEEKLKILTQNFSRKTKEITLKRGKNKTMSRERDGKSRKISKNLQVQGIFEGYKRDKMNISSLLRLNVEKIFQKSIQK